MTKSTARSLEIDRDNAVPLYHQIFLILRDQILSGQRPYGSAAPTEAELSSSYAVSRITARRALDELAEHRFVERRRRVGTRVIFKPLTRPLEGSVDQAVETLIAFGRRTKVMVREIANEDAAPEIAASLMLPVGAPVVRAVRIRFLDGEPLGQIISHVPAALGQLITKTNLSRSPLLELLKTSGLAIGDAQQTITASLADPALAMALGIETRAAILRVHRVVIDKAGQPLLATTAQYRGDRYRIALDLHGGVGVGGA